MLLQFFAGCSLKEHETLHIKFDSFLQFVHGLWASGWIAFVVAGGNIGEFYTS